MKPTKRRKGADFQRWIEAYLKERGFIVRNFPMTGKMIKYKDKETGEWKQLYKSLENDVFGCDLVARKKLAVDYVDKFGHRITNGLYWIQGTYQAYPKKRLEEFKKYFKFLLPGEKVQLWIKNKKGEINIKELDLDNDKFIDIGKIIRRKFYKVGEE